MENQLIISEDPISSQSYESKSFIEIHFGVRKVPLTKPLWEQYKTQLMKMIVDQYYNKDPSCGGLSHSQVKEYFEDEYKTLFEDKSIVETFLVFDKDNSFVGTFMFRDAYLYTKLHRECLEKLKPNEPFYDYYLQFCNIADGFIKNHELREGNGLYGTNLAFTSAFLNKLQDKVLLFLMAFFIEMSMWISKKRIEEGKIRFGMWTQFRKSLMTATESIFDVIDSKDFSFKAYDDTQCNGKLFFVKDKSQEHLMKFWKTVSTKFAKL